MGDIKKLKLNFLNEENKSTSLDKIETILHEYGEEISKYAKGYFNYFVVTTSVANKMKEGILYFIIPEIGYDCRILSLGYVNSKTVRVKFFTLKTEQSESVNISIAKGWDLVHEKISKLLSSDLANETFRFLINEVRTHRESDEE